MEQPKKINPAITAIIIIVLVGIVATTAIVINNNSQSPITGFSALTSPGTTTFGTSHASYKDGTYSATASYASPGGTNSIDLTVTLVSGVITSVSLNQNARSGESRQYQAAFASGYKDMVVGKSANDVSLSRVAGSSLTSNGFNQALELIKNNAAA